MGLLDVFEVVVNKYERLDEVIDIYFKKIDRIVMENPDLNTDEIKKMIEAELEEMAQMGVLVNGYTAEGF